MERRVRVVLSVIAQCSIGHSYQQRITNQLRRLGGSYDWDRVAFTMDEVWCCRIFGYSTLTRLCEDSIESRCGELLSPSRRRRALSCKPSRELVCPYEHHALELGGESSRAL